MITGYTVSISAGLVARLPHEQQVLTVAFSHDGTRLATGSQDALKIWEIE
jgi:hypothetical protein